MEKRPEGVTRKEPGERSQKNTVIILSVIAVLLAGVLAFVLIQKGKLVKELNEEKEELTQQIESLQADYEELSSDYDEINAQLDSSRAEVGVLVEKIRKAEATNRSQIRRYQKELGTLRAIMRNYIVQIDSLNTLNHMLQADAAAARKETAKVRKENVSLQEKVSSLSDKVVSGSIVRASNIKAVPCNKNGKAVERSSQVSRIVISLTLSENALAEHGPLRIYAVITDPDGNLLTNERSQSCTYAGGVLETSVSREIDYQGEEVGMSIYMLDVPQYVKGIYSVQVLTEKALLGTAQFILR